MKFLELEAAGEQPDDSTLKHYSKWSLTLYFCNLILNYTVGIKTASKTSHLFPLDVTPPGIFFSIWATIFRTHSFLPL